MCSKLSISVGFAVIVCLFHAPTTAAEPPITIEDVRVGFAEQPAAGLFKIGAWTPVRIDVKAGPERFQGVLEVIVPDDDGTETRVRQVLDLGAGQPGASTVYVRPGTRMPTFRVQALDREGRPRGKGVELSDPEPVEPGQVLIATLGNPRGVDEVPTLPGFSSSGVQPPQVHVAKVRPGSAFTPDGLPDRWYGYDAAQAVVLDTNDVALMDALNAGKGQALDQWVRRGGHLVVAVGSNWQAVNDSMLKPMLPALPAGLVPLYDPASLESFAGAGRLAGTISAASLRLVEGRSARVLARTAAVPPTLLVVRGALGFGRVTVVGLDVDQKPFSDWPGKKEFWLRALDLRGRGETSANAATMPGAEGSFYQAHSGDPSSMLHLTLEHFPGVRLVPFGWVAFFVFLYILLIGPGDYLLLKKVLKRMELTWITFPTIVIGVSLLAYAAACAIKGTELRINKIDALDVDQTGPSATLRGRTWLTLFSPGNRDYDIEVEPVALDLDPKSASTASRRLPPGSEPLISWFAGPDPVMGGGSRLGFSGASYAYAPLGEAERLERVRVAIWSTKSVSARWSGPASPVVDSGLRAAGPERLAGTVTNRLPGPLKDAWLAFGRQVYMLGTIEPGATVQVERQTNRVLSHVLQERAQPFRPGSPVYVEADSQAAAPPRGDLIRAAMFRGALTSKDLSAPVGATLHDLDLSGQLSLDRPILIAGFDRPAALLHLDGAASTPKIDQETVVRALLPLTAESGTSTK